MVWLLCGLVLLGRALLLAVAVPLLRRLRDNRVEITALRITLDAESARLRVGQELLRAWRAGRARTRSHEPRRDVGLSAGGAYSRDHPADTGS